MKAPIQPASSPHLGLCFVPTWKDPFYPPPTQHFSFFKAQFNLACPTTSHQAQGSSFQGILWHLSPYSSGGRGVKSPGLLSREDRHKPLRARTASLIHLCTLGALLHKPHTMCVRSSACTPKGPGPHQDICTISPFSETHECSNQLYEDGVTVQFLFKPVNRSRSNNRTQSS